MKDARETLAGRLRWQAEWCLRLGSPLYAAILEGAATDLEQGGPAWRLLEGREREPAASFVQLRLMGAVHRLVLMGRIPELAAVYPSVGGTADLERGPSLFVEALDAHSDEIRAHLDRPVQTNEVSRCAGLLGGFLTIARETGLPLSLREVGASAGLHLRFDRYRYVSGDWAWGDPDSPVRFEDVFESAAPALHPIEIADRRGCDANPLDPRSEEDRLTLMSFVWPDQVHRFEVLRGALEIASRDDVTVERASAADWVEEVLATPTTWAATVVYHSIVVQYLSADDGRRMHDAITAAGEAATVEAPLAWLFLEPGEQQTDVRLTLWPGGEQRLLARATFQASDVIWLGQPGVRASA
jgi:hypothetical protein